MTFARQIDFAALTEAQIAEHALNAAQAAFEAGIKNGLPKRELLYITVGTSDAPMHYQEWGARAIGGAEAEQYKPNTDPETGKLAPVLMHRIDSSAAYWSMGERIPEGPQRYTGGIIHVVRVNTKEKGWMTRIFVAAASGVEGHIDEATAYTTATHAGAFWALQQTALYGEG